MINFADKIESKSVEKKIHPIDIYNTADRKSATGELRLVQKSVLNDWFEKFQSEKDVILKLHTGQGKTLIGLLILQSMLNQDKGPALYLCPNKYLITQTQEQAKLFGIKTVTTENDLPQSFLDNKAILITTVQKLFNGISKFGLNAKYSKVGSIVMDDAHACIETIRNQFIVRIDKGELIYSEILQLFHSDLENQGVGTFADIKQKGADAYLPIPYWVWYDKHVEVSSILAKNKDKEYLRYTWPIIKDKIKDCQCILAGDKLEITPYFNPVENFYSYVKADHRVFMSATINDDSFLFKNLSVSEKSIKSPLIYKDEKWSGEKMILIPELINENLDRVEIINHFSKSKRGRKYGVVGLTPSNKQSEIWKNAGATVADKDSLEIEVDKLKKEDCENTLVLVNRYDGIDLPDTSCRLLILDSKPYSQTLADKYQENCRPESEFTEIKIAQKIEQGLGRAVRGEKDFCAVILTGPELIRTVKSKRTSKFFSPQTRTQIDIAIKVAEYAEKDEDNPINIVTGLLNQSLSRDAGWKAFYEERMNQMPFENLDKRIIDILNLERIAEQMYFNSDFDGAATAIQKLIDNYITDDLEKGWYLQEKARYIYPLRKSESNVLQIAAHRLNNFLLKPLEGMVIRKITVIGQKRIENIKTWIKQFESFEELKLKLNEIISNLSFGTKSEKFEQALDDIGKAIGFYTERPDKQWKEGPDNIWLIRDNEYILFECKNEVDVKRVEINKDETKQMNNSIVWFETHYDAQNVKNVLVIPGRLLGKGAALDRADVELLRVKQLSLLHRNVRNFFNEFKELDFNDMSDNQIQNFLDTHKLSIEEIKSIYYEKISIS